MDLKISEEILQQTTKCKFNFACLIDEKYPLCQVKKQISSVTFVTSSGSFCNYSMPYGYGFVCNCPTRKEVYKKYNK